VKLFSKETLHEFAKRAVLVEHISVKNDQGGFDNITNKYEGHAAVDHYMQLHGCTFNEAIEQLCRSYGITPKYVEKIESSPEIKAKRTQALKCVLSIKDPEIQEYMLTQLLEYK
jgi:hypothetical protein